MSFLIRYVATEVQSGEVTHDETVVASVEALFAIEKSVFVLGQELNLRIEFDPPLQPVEAP